MGLRGRRTLEYDGVFVRSWHSIAGKFEGEGPHGGDFSEVLDDDMDGKATWEQAESGILERCVRSAAKSAGLTPQTLGVFLGGDLLNQIIATSYAARGLQTPFLGLYGACSTMAQSLLIGGALVSGGFFKTAACAASSHYCSAERQYRFPLEYGSVRAACSQRTVTAAGCAVLGLSGEKSGIRVTLGTVGRVIDLGIKDPANMGAAMAPADDRIGQYQRTREMPRAGRTPRGSGRLYGGRHARLLKRGILSRRLIKRLPSRKPGNRKPHRVKCRALLQHRKSEQAAFHARCF